MDSRDIVSRMEKFAGAPALVEANGETVSYAELAVRVRRVAARVRELVGNAQRIACLIRRPSIPWITLLYALLWEQREIVLLSAALPSPLLQNAQTQTQWQAAIAERTTTALGPAISLAECFAGAPPATDGQDSPAEWATVIRTSGSSGEAKFVALSFANHWASAVGAFENIPFGTGDRWLLSLPLYHISGLSLLFRALVAGGTLVIAEAWQMLPHLELDYVSLVPTQLFRLLQTAEGVAALQRMKAVLLGGAAAASSLLSKALEHRIPIRTTYGLTETASQVTTLPETWDLTKWESAGCVLPYRQVKIVNGEILVAGEVLARGYLRNAVLQPLPQQQGYFATGDLGRWDDDGYLYVLGRKDAMFLSGGMKIFPEEIEKALLEMPGVLRTCVVPVPSDEYGYRPVAFVEWESDEVALPEALIRERLRHRLESYKIPDRVLPLPEVFRSRMMKLPRHLLRQYAEAIMQQ